MTQEEVSSCDTRIGVFLCDKKRFLFVPQDLLVARRNLFLCHKKSFLLVSQEEISSCVTRKDRIEAMYIYIYIYIAVVWLYESWEALVACKMLHGCGNYFYTRPAHL